MQRLFLLALAGTATLGIQMLPAATRAGTLAATYANGAQRGPSRYAGFAFVSDMDDSTVWICPTGNIRVGFLPPTEQLQGVTDPVQLAIDRAGTVYVANAEIDSSGQGAVTVYPRGQLSPTRTLSSGLNVSTGVAVDSTGNVYVSNKYSATIQVFAPKRSVPSATIAKGLHGPDGLAIDKDDNLFVADGSSGDVLEVVHGSLTPQPLHLHGLSRPVGVAVDSHDNLYVSNLDGGKSQIAEYARGAQSPERTFVVPYSPNAPPGTIGESTMLSIGPDDMLIASAYITLVPVEGQLFGSSPVIAGFASGQSRPEWSAYGLFAWDTVFQAAR